METTDTQLNEVTGLTEPVEPVTVATPEKPRYVSPYGMYSPMDDPAMAPTKGRTIIPNEDSWYTATGDFKGDKLIRAMTLGSLSAIPMAMRGLFSDKTISGASIGISSTSDLARTAELLNKAEGMGEYASEMLLNFVPKALGGGVAALAEATAAVGEIGAATSTLLGGGESSFMEGMSKRGSDGTSMGEFAQFLKDFSTETKAYSSDLMGKIEQDPHKSGWKSLKTWEEGLSTIAGMFVGGGIVKAGLGVTTKAMTPVLKATAKIMGTAMASSGKVGMASKAAWLINKFPALGVIDQNGREVISNIYDNAKEKGKSDEEAANLAAGGLLWAAALSMPGLLFEGGKITKSLLTFGSMEEAAKLISKSSLKDVLKEGAKEGSTELLESIGTHIGTINGIDDKEGWAGLENMLVGAINHTSSDEGISSLIIGAALGGGTELALGSYNRYQNAKKREGIKLQVAEYDTNGDILTEGGKIKTKAQSYESYLDYNKAKQEEMVKLRKALPNLLKESFIKSDPEQFKKVTEKFMAHKSTQSYLEVAMHDSLLSATDKELEAEARKQAQEMTARATAEYGITDDEEIQKYEDKQYQSMYELLTKAQKARESIESDPSKLKEFRDFVYKGYYDAVEKTAIEHKVEAHMEQMLGNSTMFEKGGLFEHLQSHNTHQAALNEFVKSGNSVGLDMLSLYNISSAYNMALTYDSGKEFLGSINEILGGGSLPSEILGTTAVGDTLRAAKHSKVGQFFSKASPADLKFDLIKSMLTKVQADRDLIRLMYPVNSKSNNEVVVDKLYKLSSFIRTLEVVTGKNYSEMFKRDPNELYEFSEDQQKLLSERDTHIKEEAKLSEGLKSIQLNKKNLNGERDTIINNDNTLGAHVAKLNGELRPPTNADNAAWNDKVMVSISEAQEKQREFKAQLDALDYDAKLKDIETQETDIKTKLKANQNILAQSDVLHSLKGKIDKIAEGALASPVNVETLAKFKAMHKEAVKMYNTLMRGESYIESLKREIKEKRAKEKVEKEERIASFERLLNGSAGSFNAQDIYEELVGIEEDKLITHNSVLEGGELVAEARATRKEALEMALAEGYSTEVIDLINSEMNKVNLSSGNKQLSLVVNDSDTTISYPPDNDLINIDNIRNTLEGKDFISSIKFEGADGELQSLHDSLLKEDGGTKRLKAALEGKFGIYISLAELGIAEGTLSKEYIEKLESMGLAHRNESKGVSTLMLKIGNLKPSAYILALFNRATNTLGDIQYIRTHSRYSEGIAKYNREKSKAKIGLDVLNSANVELGYFTTKETEGKSSQVFVGKDKTSTQINSIGTKVGNSRGIAIKVNNPNNKNRDDGSIVKISPIHPDRTKVIEMMDGIAARLAMSAIVSMHRKDTKSTEDIEKVLNKITYAPLRAKVKAMLEVMKEPGKDNDNTFNKEVIHLKNFIKLDFILQAKKEYLYNTYIATNPKYAGQKGKDAGISLETVTITGISLTEHNGKFMPTLGFKVGTNEYLAKLGNYVALDSINVDSDNIGTQSIQSLYDKLKLMLTPEGNYDSHIFEVTTADIAAFNESKGVESKFKQYKYLTNTEAVSVSPEEKFSEFLSNNYGNANMEVQSGKNTKGEPVAFTKTSKTLTIEPFNDITISKKDATSTSLGDGVNVDYYQEDLTTESGNDVFFVSEEWLNKLDELGIHDEDLAKWIADYKDIITILTSVKFRSFPIVKGLIDIVKTNSAVIANVIDTEESDTYSKEKLKQHFKDLSESIDKLKDTDTKLHTIIQSNTESKIRIKYITKGIKSINTTLGDLPSIANKLKELNQLFPPIDVENTQKLDLKDLEESIQKQQEAFNVQLDELVIATREAVGIRFSRDVLPALAAKDPTLKIDPTNVGNSLATLSVLYPGIDSFNILKSFLEGNDLDFKTGNIAYSGVYNTVALLSIYVSDSSKDKSGKPFSLAQSLMKIESHLSMLASLRHVLRNTTNKTLLKEDKKIIAEESLQKLEEVILNIDNKHKKLRKSLDSLQEEKERRLDIFTNPSLAEFAYAAENLILEFANMAKDPKDTASITNTQVANSIYKVLNQLKGYTLQNLGKDIANSLKKSVRDKTSIGIEATISFSDIYETSIDIVNKYIKEDGRYLRDRDDNISITDKSLISLDSFLYTEGLRKSDPAAYEAQSKEHKGLINLIKYVIARLKKDSYSIDVGDSTLGLKKVLAPLMGELQDAVDRYNDIGIDTTSFQDPDLYTPEFVKQFMGSIENTKTDETYRYSEVSALLKNLSSGVGFEFQQSRLYGKILNFSPTTLDERFSNLLTAAYANPTAHAFKPIFEAILVGAFKNLAFTYNTKLLNVPKGMVQLQLSDKDLEMVKQVMGESMWQDPELITIEKILELGKTQYSNLDTNGLRDLGGPIHTNLKVLKLSKLFMGIMGSTNNIPAAYRYLNVNNMGRTSVAAVGEFSAAHTALKEHQNRLADNGLAHKVGKNVYIGNVENPLSLIFGVYCDFNDGGQTNAVTKNDKFNHNFVRLPDTIGKDKILSESEKTSLSTNIQEVNKLIYQKETDITDDMLYTKETKGAYKGRPRSTVRLVGKLMQELLYGISNSEDPDDKVILFKDPAKLRKVVIQLLRKRMINNKQASLNYYRTIRQVVVDTNSTINVRTSNGTTVNLVKDDKENFIKAIDANIELLKQDIDPTIGGDYAKKAEETIQDLATILSYAIYTHNDVLVKDGKKPYKFITANNIRQESIIEQFESIEDMTALFKKVGLELNENVIDSLFIQSSERNLKGRDKIFNTKEASNIGFNPMAFETQGVYGSIFDMPHQTASNISIDEVITDGNIKYNVVVDMNILGNHNSGLARIANIEKDSRHTGQKVLQANAEGTRSQSNPNSRAAEATKNILNKIYTSDDLIDDRKGRLRTVLGDSTYDNVLSDSIADAVAESRKMSLKFSKQKAFELLGTVEGVRTSMATPIGGLISGRFPLYYFDSAHDVNTNKSTGVRSFGEMDMNSTLFTFAMHDIEFLGDLKLTHVYSAVNSNSKTLPILTIIADDPFAVREDIASRIDGALSADARSYVRKELGIDGIPDPTNPKNAPLREMGNNIFKGLDTGTNPFFSKFSNFVHKKHYDELYGLKTIPIGNYGYTTTETDPTANIHSSMMLLDTDTVEYLSNVYLSDLEYIINGTHSNTGEALDIKTVGLTNKALPQYMSSLNYSVELVTIVDKIETAIKYSYLSAVDSIYALTDNEVIDIVHRNIVNNSLYEWETPLIETILKEARALNSVLSKDKKAVNNTKIDRTALKVTTVKFSALKLNNSELLNKVLEEYQKKGLISKEKIEGKESITVYDVYKLASTLVDNDYGSTIDSTKDPVKGLERAKRISYLSKFLLYNSNVVNSTSIGANPDKSSNSFVNVMRHKVSKTIGDNVVEGFRNTQGIVMPALLTKNNKSKKSINPSKYNREAHTKLLSGGKELVGKDRTAVYEAEELYMSLKSDNSITLKLNAKKGESVSQVVPNMVRVQVSQMFGTFEFNSLYGFNLNSIPKGLKVDINTDVYNALSPKTDAVGKELPEEIYNTNVQKLASKNTVADNLDGYITAYARNMREATDVMTKRYKGVMSDSKVPMLTSGDTKEVDTKKFKALVLPSFEVSIDQLHNQETLQTWINDPKINPSLKKLLKGAYGSVKQADGQTFIDLKTTIERLRSQGDILDSTLEHNYTSILKLEEEVLNRVNRGEITIYTKEIIKKYNDIQEFIVKTYMDAPAQKTIYYANNNETEEVNGLRSKNTVFIKHAELIVSPIYELGSGHAALGTLMNRMGINMLGTPDSFKISTQMNTVDREALKAGKVKFMEAFNLQYIINLVNLKLIKYEEVLQALRSLPASTTTSIAPEEVYQLLHDNLDPDLFNFLHDDGFIIDPKSVDIKNIVELIEVEFSLLNNESLVSNLKQLNSDLNTVLADLQSKMDDTSPKGLSKAVHNLSFHGYGEQNRVTTDTKNKGERLGSQLSQIIMSGLTPSDTIDMQLDLHVDHMAHVFGLDEANRLEGTKGTGKLSVSGDNYRNLVRSMQAAHLFSNGLDYISDSGMEEVISKIDIENITSPALAQLVHLVFGEGNDIDKKDYVSVRNEIAALVQSDKDITSKPATYLNRFTSLMDFLYSGTYDIPTIRKAVSFSILLHTDLLGSANVKLSKELIEKLITDTLDKHAAQQTVHPSMKFRDSMFDSEGNSRLPMVLMPMGDIVLARSLALLNDLLEPRIAGKSFVQITPMGLELDTTVPGYEKDAITNNLVIDTSTPAGKAALNTMLSNGGITIVKEDWNPTDGLSGMDKLIDGTVSNEQVLIKPHYIDDKGNKVDVKSFVVERNKLRAKLEAFVRVHGGIDFSVNENLAQVKTTESLLKLLKDLVPSLDSKIAEVIATDIAKLEELNSFLKPILQGYALRIPSQHPSFFSAIEVVGFLPEECPATVVVSNIVVAKVGADFDIDKYYIYTKPIKSEQMLIDGKKEIVHRVPDSNNDYYIAKNRSKLIPKDKVSVSNHVDKIEAQLIDIYRSRSLSQGELLNNYTPSSAENYQARKAFPSKLRHYSSYTTSGTSFVATGKSESFDGNIALGVVAANISRGASDQHEGLRFKHKLKGNTSALVYGESDRFNADVSHDLRFIYTTTNDQGGLEINYMAHNVEQYMDKDNSAENICSKRSEYELASEMSLTRRMYRMDMKYAVPSRHTHFSRDENGNIKPDNNPYKNTLRISDHQNSSMTVTVDNDKEKVLGPLNLGEKSTAIANLMGRLGIDDLTVIDFFDNYTLNRAVKFAKNESSATGKTLDDYVPLKTKLELTKDEIALLKMIHLNMDAIVEVGKIPIDQRTEEWGKGIPTKFVNVGTIFEECLRSYAGEPNVLQDGSPSHKKYVALMTSLTLRGVISYTKGFATFTNLGTALHHELHYDKLNEAAKALSTIDSTRKLVVDRIQSKLGAIFAAFDRVESSEQLKETDAFHEDTLNSILYGDNRMQIVDGVMNLMKNLYTGGNRSLVPLMDFNTSILRAMYDMDVHVKEGEDGYSEMYEQSLIFPVLKQFIFESGHTAEFMYKKYLPYLVQDIGFYREVLTSKNTHKLYTKDDEVMHSLFLEELSPYYKHLRTFMNDLQINGDRLDFNASFEFNGPDYNYAIDVIRKPELLLGDIHINEYMEGVTTTVNKAIADFNGHKKRMEHVKLRNSEFDFNTNTFLNTSLEAMLRSSKMANIVNLEMISPTDPTKTITLKEYIGSYLKAYAEEVTKAGIKFSNIDDITKIPFHIPEISVNSLMPTKLAVEDKAMSAIRIVVNSLKHSSTMKGSNLPEHTLYQKLITQELLHRGFKAFNKSGSYKYLFDVEGLSATFSEMIDRSFNNVRNPALGNSGMYMEDYDDYLDEYVSNPAIDFLTNFAESLFPRNYVPSADAENSVIVEYTYDGKLMRVPIIMQVRDVDKNTGSSDSSTAPSKTPKYRAFRVNGKVVIGVKIGERDSANYDNYNVIAREIGKLMDGSEEGTIKSIPLDDITVMYPKEYLKQTGETVSYRIIAANDENFPRFGMNAELSLTQYIDDMNNNKYDLTGTAAGRNKMAATFEDRLESSEFTLDDTDIATTRMGSKVNELMPITRDRLTRSSITAEEVNTSGLTSIPKPNLTRSKNTININILTEDDAPMVTRDKEIMKLVGSDVPILNKLSLLPELYKYIKSSLSDVLTDLDSVDTTTEDLFKAMGISIKGELNPIYKDSIRNRVANALKSMETLTKGGLNMLLPVYGYTVARYATMYIGDINLDPTTVTPRQKDFYQMLNLFLTTIESTDTTYTLEYSDDTLAPGKLASATVIDTEEEYTSKVLVSRSIHNKKMKGNDSILTTVLTEELTHISQWYTQYVLSVAKADKTVALGAISELLESQEEEKKNEILNSVSKYIDLYTGFTELVKALALPKSQGKSAILGDYKLANNTQVYKLLEYMSEDIAEFFANMNNPIFTEWIHSVATPTGSTVNPSFNINGKPSKFSTVVKDILSLKNSKGITSEAGVTEFSGLHELNSIIKEYRKNNLLSEVLNNNSATVSTTLKTQC